jgi:hypothetical protein
LTSKLLGSIAQVRAANSLKSVCQIDRPLTAYFEDSYDAIFGVVYRPAFEARLRSHFENHVSAEDDPSWYALRNTVYASGCRIFLAKDHSTTFSDAQGHAW